MFGTYSQSLEKNWGNKNWRVQKYGKIVHTWKLWVEEYINYPILATLL